MGTFDLDLLRILELSSIASNIEDDSLREVVPHRYRDLHRLGHSPLPRRAEALRRRFNRVESCLIDLATGPSVSLASIDIFLGVFD